MTVGGGGVGRRRRIFGAQAGSQAEFPFGAFLTYKPDPSSTFLATPPPAEILKLGYPYTSRLFLSRPFEVGFLLRIGCHKVGGY